MTRNPFATSHHLPDLITQPYCRANDCPQSGETLLGLLLDRSFGLVGESGVPSCGPNVYLSDALSSCLILVSYVLLEPCYFLMLNCVGVLIGIDPSPFQTGDASERG